jgi:hypothetical protein
MTLMTSGVEDYWFAGMGRFEDGLYVFECGVAARTKPKDAVCRPDIHQ